MTNIKVAYLGPVGTFTEKAARKSFPQSELVPLSSNRRVIRAVETEEALYGVVPIENFYQGEVRDTLDALIETEKVGITGETFLKVVHCFGVLPQHGDILKILSKDQALDQCGKYLCEKYPNAETMAVSSTAEAARIIKEQAMLYAAAIASKEALLKQGLEVLAEDICPNNRTKFIILGNDATNSTGDDKTLIALHPHIRDKPGVLSGILSVISALDINLDYVQSRPDGKGGYYFYVELNGHEKDERVDLALRTIKLLLDPKKEQKNTLKVLGSYPNTRWKDDN